MASNTAAAYYNTELSLHSIFIIMDEWKEHILPCLLWIISSATLTYVVRTRKSEILLRKPVLAFSPRARGLSADHIVAIEKSDKGALIDHPRRQALKNDFVGFSTMQRKLILVMVGK